MVVVWWVFEITFLQEMNYHGQVFPSQHPQHGNKCGYEEQIERWIVPPSPGMLPVPGQMRG